jgi:hypothetical protein
MICAPKPGGTVAFSLWLKRRRQAILATRRTSRSLRGGRSSIQVSSSSGGASVRTYTPPDETL